MRVLRLRTTATALAAFLCFTAIAVAEEPAEAFLKSWIASIDAAPEWRATYSSLSSDPAGSRTTIYGVSVTSVSPGFSLAFDSVAVTGFVPSAEGTFAATEVRLDGGEIGAGFVTIGIANAAFRNFVLPSGGGFSWDRAQPFAAMIKALAPLAKAKMTTGRIGSLVVTEEIEGVTSRASYGQIVIEGWADGKIASIKAGPLKTETPAEEPLTAIAVATAESRDIDLDAMLALYDPERYVGGVGDLVWRTTVGKATYRDIVAAIPGVGLTIAEASIADFKVRQPKGGIGILLRIDAPGAGVPADDPAAAASALGLLSAYGVGKFDMRDLEVRAIGIDRMRMGRLSLTDFSSDKIGEFAIDDLESAVGGQGSVTIGHLAFGGLVLPPFESVMAAVKAENAGDDVDVSAILPTIGFVEAADVDIALAALPRTMLTRFRVDLDNYVGQVPTSIALDLAGADVPTDLIAYHRARRLLEDFGYDRALIDAGLTMDWDEAGEIAVKNYRLAIKDVGAVSGDAILTGLRPSEAADLAQDAALERLSLVRGSLTVTDDSIVGRGLAAQAARLKADPAKFREQFATGLPFMLTFLGDMNLQKQLAPVLQAFVRTTGGSITAMAGPASPVPLSLIAAAGETAPFTLLKMLSVSFSGVAGEPPPPSPIAVPAPAAPAAATPTIRTTIEP